MTPKHTNPLMWESIFDVQRTLKLSDQDLAELLQLPLVKFVTYKSQRKDLSLPSVMSLADELDVGFENIMTGKLDMGYVRRKYNLAPPELPERYQVAAFSKRISSNYFLDFVRQKYGETHLRCLLKSLHLDSSLFESTTETINLLFPADVIGYLRKYRLISDSDIPLIGIQAASTFEKLGMAEKIRQQGNHPKQIFEALAHSFLSKNIERNYEYKLEKVSNESCTLTTKPTQEIMDLFKQNLGTEPVCQVRMGVAISLPEMLGGPRPTYIKTACALQGDPFCRFTVNYSNFNKIRHIH